MDKRTYSMSTLLVLRALMDDQPDEHYGLRLIATTGVKAGALHPILSRLRRTARSFLALGGDR